VRWREEWQAGRGRDDDPLTWLAASLGWPRPVLDQATVERRPGSRLAGHRLPRRSAAANHHDTAVNEPTAAAGATDAGSRPRPTHPAPRQGQCRGILLAEGAHEQCGLRLGLRHGSGIGDERVKIVLGQEPLAQQRGRNPLDGGLVLIYQSHCVWR
jgi:hypothetical protein